MNFQPHRFLTWSRTRMLAAAGVIIMGTLSATVMDSPAALADPTVHTLVANVTESWGPNTSSEIGEIQGENSNITISCYVTGQTVTGHYGSENVWDLVSGGIDAQNGSYVETGVFVPDALIYTGSNSPIVPHCSMAPGTMIGDNWVNVYSVTTADPNYVVGSVDSGEAVELECYSTGTWVDGPYGWEDIWDQITGPYGSPEYVPDALVYTGSNSPVVPQCNN